MAASLSASILDANSEKAILYYPWVGAIAVASI
jgi:hypothetical protein